MERRIFTQEFKEQVVREANQSDNAAAVARKHGIEPRLLYRWSKQFKEAPNAATALAEVAAGQEEVAAVTVLNEAVTPSETAAGHTELIFHLEKLFSTFREEFMNQLTRLESSQVRINRRIADVQFDVSGIRKQLLDSLTP